MDRWRDSGNLVARLNLPNMRVPAGGRVEAYEDAFRGLLALESNPGRRMKYLDFINRYAEPTDNERQEYRRRHSEESKVMAGVVQRQGRGHGMKHATGPRRGRARALQRQLSKRFGQLPAATMRRLVAASTANIENWAEKVLAAESLEGRVRQGRPFRQCQDGTPSNGTPRRVQGSTIPDAADVFASAHVGEKPRSAPIPRRILSPCITNAKWRPQTARRPARKPARPVLAQTHLAPEHR